MLNVTSQEIIFSSGGTEANNWIIKSAVRDLKIQRIITSKLEHHAVLHSVLSIQKEYNIKVDFVKTCLNGTIDLTNLVELLTDNSPTLVSLMHVNNETGEILDLERVCAICKQSNALFHTDSVQSIGKTKIDLQQTKIDFLVASAHKFHGPKGIGFAFVRKGISLRPMIYGGEQEKGLRAGTESVHNVVGMAEALEISYANLESEKEYTSEIKKYCIAELIKNFPQTKIVGSITFYNIVNIILPFSDEKTSMFLFHLDMKGIAVSRGSACQSGSNKPSHVLAELLSENDLKKPNLRISFSHYTTRQEIDYLIKVLKTI